ncbi:MAG: hypothetical protein DMF20_07310, partial [Verrucomicrobia bacterium]
SMSYHLKAFYRHARPKLQQQLVGSLKYMKTPRQFKSTYLFSLVRTASAVTLLSAAAAMAFVAVESSGPLSWAKADNKDTIDKVRQNRAALFRNKLAIPGPQQEGGPMAAAEENYSNRAAGRAYVPFQLTSNAQQAWKRIKSQRNRNTVGTWTLAGPSKADDPNVLTFSSAEYFTSGRITALAIDPSCNNTRCRVWAAAAGGGVWQTNNALSGNGASWTFVSGSFSTNAIGTLTYDAAHNTLYAGTGEPNASGDSEAGFGALTARASSGPAAFSKLPLTLVLHSMVVRSPRLLSILPIRVSCTLHPRGGYVGSARLQVVPEAVLPAFRRTDYGSPLTAGRTSRF